MVVFETCSGDKEGRRSRLARCGLGDPVAQPGRRRDQAPLVNRGADGETSVMPAAATALDQIQHVTLSPEQERLAAEACAAIDADLMRRLVVGMVDIPSPTGEEGQLAAWLAGTMADLGLDARYQPIDDLQGNAIGRLAGRGDGAHLLLYAPIDTLTVGDPAEDRKSVV